MAPDTFQEAPLLVSAFHTALRGRSRLMDHGPCVDFMNARAEDEAGTLVAAILRQIKRGNERIAPVISFVVWWPNVGWSTCGPTSRHRRPTSAKTLSARADHLPPPPSTVAAAPAQIGQSGRSFDYCVRVLLTVTCALVKICGNVCRTGDRQQTCVWVHSFTRASIIGHDATRVALLRCCVGLFIYVHSGAHRPSHLARQSSVPGRLLLWRRHAEDEAEPQRACVLAASWLSQGRVTRWLCQVSLEHFNAVPPRGPSRSCGHGRAAGGIWRQWPRRGPTTRSCFRMRPLSLKSARATVELASALQVSSTSHAVGAKSGSSTASRAATVVSRACTRNTKWQ